MTTSPSAILGRLAEDLRPETVPDADGGAGPLRVEGVLPRRIGSFRADATIAPSRDVRWLRSYVVVPPGTYFDLTAERLTTLVAEELTAARGLGYRASPDLGGRGVNIAFCSPNANKPLHLGHARNMVVGAAVANLLELTGARVRRSCCLSDYGMHVFAALAAYLREGDGTTPGSTGEKPDHFVGRFYAGAGANPAPARGDQDPAQLMRWWLEGCETVREQTRLLASWAEAGFDETFDDWSIRFDHRFRETREHPVIERFLAHEVRTGRVRRDEAGRSVVVLPGGEVVPLTRSGGSPLYMSHMVAAVLQRLEAFGPGVRTLVTITGEEQVVPFRQLAAVLRHFGYATDVELRHVTHGLVRVGGRSLSSREGTAMTIDAVVDELAGRLGAGDGGPAPQRRHARTLLRLSLLARAMDKPVDHRPADCLRDAGRSAADIAGALRRANATPSGAPGAEDARSYGWITMLAAYPTVLDRAVFRLDPSVLVHYLVRLCREFLSLHTRGRVDARLLAPTGAVVRHALGLLGLPDEPDLLSAPRAAALARSGS